MCSSDLVTACGASDDAGSASCVAPNDRAARAGECTIVDWDALAVHGESIELEYYVNEPGCSLDLDRVEVDETDESVTLTVVVGYSGEEGWSCPTAYASRTTTVSLAEPLGTKSLLGCRPEVSFVPKGGYNEPEPRNPSIDCTPQG